MEKKSKVSEVIELPEHVEVLTERGSLILKKGALETRVHAPLVVQAEGKKISYASRKFTKKDKRAWNTLKALVIGALKGFEKKYVYKLQISAVHFPMSVTFDKTKRQITIKNFLGERVPRIAKVLPGVDVKVEKEFVILESHDKYAAGQSAANVESATRISNRDRRVFQDGIWMIEKAGEEI